MRPARPDERGGSNTIATVLLLPVFMLAILGTFQAAVWYAGRQSALAAVQAAAEAERVARPTAGAGQNAAQSVAQQGGLVDTHISVRRSADSVTVTLSAKVPMFFDIGVGWFSEHATMPREKVSTP